MLCAYSSHVANNNDQKFASGDMLRLADQTIPTFSVKYLGA